MNFDGSKSFLVSDLFDNYADLMADPSCVCSGGFATVDKIDTVPVVQATAPAIGGLSHDDTAILAGILTGLATFLFLALPILCCLCPLPCCPCCGGGAAGSKSKRTAGAIGAAKVKEMETISHRSTDVDSVHSFRTFNKEWDKLDKYDYDNLYEVDMKLPRAWLESLRGVPNDQIDSKLRELESGWEGQDVRNYELEALRHENLLRHENMMNADAGYQSGTGSVGYSNAAYRGDGYAEGMGSMGGGIEIERTRQINITTAASQLPEQEYIMEREFRQELGGLENDNFEKIYTTYRRLLNDSKQTSF
ncbi:uncharacterized protein LOC133193378 [Saccostrea echinata]|uniref:uncharacterized protein LOC133193378 n=1 Tax=Saccostrea echinata TaxID=191078 RepID=UPI002A812889|nr:uncharacterized protein LOC133193378 [Saccostrea echinata]